MTKTDEHGIRAAYRAGDVFGVRAEYIGANPTNASGRSSKFWGFERTRRDGQITIRYGRIGSQGRTCKVGVSLYDAL
ncbi:WGR domain-containing protein [bacterium]|nr:WGR domain-containing protein [bacterium]